MQLHLNSYNHAIVGLPDSSLFIQRLKLWDIFVKSEKHGNLSVNSKHFSLKRALIDYVHPKPSSVDV